MIQLLEIVLSNRHEILATDSGYQMHKIDIEHVASGNCTRQRCSH